MADTTENQTPHTNGRDRTGSRVFVACFLAFAILLNAPAMLRSAENMAFDDPARKPALTLLTPVARFSSALHLDFFRASAESIERKTLE